VAADFEFYLAGFFVFLDACGCAGWLVVSAGWGFERTIVGVLVDVGGGMRNEWAFFWQRLGGVKEGSEEYYRKRLFAGRSR